MSHNETREHLLDAVHGQLDTLELPNIKHSLVREWINIALAETADDTPSPIHHRIEEADYQLTEPTDETCVRDLVNRRKAAKLGRALLLDTLAHDNSIPYIVIDEAA
jgi:hypothetical protein